MSQYSGWPTRATNLAYKHHMSTPNRVRSVDGHLRSPVMYLSLTVYPWLYALPTSLQGHGYLHMLNANRC